MVVLWNSDEIAWMGMLGCGGGGRIDELLGMGVGRGHLGTGGHVVVSGGMVGGGVV